jgi:hypothetical protein
MWTSVSPCPCGGEHDGQAGGAAALDGGHHVGGAGAVEHRGARAGLDKLEVGKIGMLATGVLSCLTVERA